MKLSFALTLPLKQQFLDARNQKNDQFYTGPGFLDVKTKRGSEFDGSLSKNKLGAKRRQSHYPVAENKKNDNIEPRKNKSLGLHKRSSLNENPNKLSNENLRKSIKEKTKFGDIKSEKVDSNEKLNVQKDDLDFERPKSIKEIKEESNDQKSDSFPDSPIKISVKDEVIQASNNTGVELAKEPEILPQKRKKSVVINTNMNEIQSQENYEQTMILEESEHSKSSDKNSEKNSKSQKKSDQSQSEESSEEYSQEPIDDIIPEDMFSMDSIKIVRNFQEHCLKIKDRNSARENFQIQLPEMFDELYPEVFQQIFKIQEKFYQVQSDLLSVINMSDEVLREAVSLCVLCGGYNLENTPSFLNGVQKAVEETEMAFESKIRTLSKTFNLEIEDLRVLSNKKDKIINEFGAKIFELKEELKNSKKVIEKNQNLLLSSKSSSDVKMKNFEEINRFIIDLLEDKKQLTATVDHQANEISRMKKTIRDIKSVRDLNDDIANIEKNEY